MKRLCLSVIRWYKRYISPTLPPSCRFLPTCSDYAYQAIERFGAVRGGLLGLWRILRCNPFCKGGYDPVPQRWPRDKASGEAEAGQDKNKKKEE